MRGSRVKVKEKQRNDNYKKENKSKPNHPSCGNKDKKKVILKLKEQNNQTRNSARTSRPPQIDKESEKAREEKKLKTKKK